MTLGIALWGAILATLTFFWNLLKWWQEHPRIFARAEAVESPLQEGCFSGIRITLRNRGGERTTVERIIFYRPKKWLEFGLDGVFSRIVPWQHNIGVSNSKAVKLPMALDVNGMWEGFIPLEANESDNEEELRQIETNREIANVLRAGKLRYSIQCSHSSSRIEGKVLFEDQFGM